MTLWPMETDQATPTMVVEEVAETEVEAMSAVHRIAGIRIALQQKEEDENVSTHKIEIYTKNETLELRHAEADTDDHENVLWTRSTSDEDRDLETIGTRGDIITMMMTAQDSNGLQYLRHSKIHLIDTTVLP